LEGLNEDFDWCIEQTLFFGEDRKPLNMILDDGDLTNMVLIATRINSWNQRFIRRNNRSSPFLSV
jgi:hypothetical protein